MRQLGRLLARLLAMPQAWWARQSLRARLTLLATALFTLAVTTGAVLVLILQRYALTRVLDSNAVKAADQTAQVISRGDPPSRFQITVSGLTGVEVFDTDSVGVATVSSSGGSALSQLPPLTQEQRHTAGVYEIDGGSSQAKFRVLVRLVPNAKNPPQTYTIAVFTDVTRVDDSLRILQRAALIGGPLAVLLMAMATYGSVALTLRPVAALRHGAADITAAGLAEQRLPVPGAQDEIHRLAVTLNAMLDRIDSATSRQRTFVGDAAHELRSPLASIRVQLEIGQRLGPESDWSGLIEDVLVDVHRLDRLVEDLLALARLDEGGAQRREPVELDELIGSVVAGYSSARVEVTMTSAPVVVDGDPDALRRIAINLVNNAVRYATRGVQVDVRPSRSGGEHLALMTVVDDGPGIKAAERELVFDRFYRVQESRSRESGGTGLGLPIVRDIVRNHGGRVRLTDREDGAPGLLAIVQLPAIDNPAAARPSLRKG